MKCRSIGTGYWLLHGQNGIDALRIANASVTVPTPADEIGPQVFIAEQAYATFRFEEMVRFKLTN